MIAIKRLNHALAFAFLVVLWLAAYKLSAIAEVLKSRSSLWFLPAGISFAIFLIAPRWLKLTPLVANLSLTLPGMDTLFDVGDNAFRDQVMHAFRHCGIYYTAAYAFKKILGEAWRQSTIRGASTYVVVTSIAAIVSAMTGVSLHVLAGNFSWDVAADIVVHWAIGDAVAALVLPPLIGPIMRKLLRGKQSQYVWPPPSAWLTELIIILAAMAVATTALVLDPELGSLWYITLLPPIFAGVRRGIEQATISVFLTAALTPIMASHIAYNGEALSLSMLLAITAISSFMIGTAVSVQKRTLAQLDAQNQQLDEIVKARTAELAEAYEFERHLVRSLGHDLRQPLQTITLLVETMAMRKSGDEPMIVALRQISSTMSSFLDGVLNYALTAPGTITPNKVPITVCAVFSALDAIYRPIAEKRGVNLVVDRSDGDLFSDEVLLRQALSNDLDNAIRLSAKGTTVTLRHELRGTQHALIVADEIAVEYANSPGTAGFGYGIVARVCSVLEAKRIKEKNIRGILLP